MAYKTDKLKARIIEKYGNQKNLSNKDIKVILGISEGGE